jgi:photosystem II P680 reaction center D1 protein
MTAIFERRESESLWGRFCNWITSTENRLYIGWFGVLMIPTLEPSLKLRRTKNEVISFAAVSPPDTDGTPSAQFASIFLRLLYTRWLFCEQIQ